MFSASIQSTVIALFSIEKKVLSCQKHVKFARTLSRVYRVTCSTGRRLVSLHTRNPFSFSREIPSLKDFKCHAVSSSFFCALPFLLLRLRLRKGSSHPIKLFVNKVLLVFFTFLPSFRSESTHLISSVPNKMVVFDPDRSSSRC